MNGPLDGLVTSIDQILADLDAAAVVHQEQISAVSDDNLAGAINLVHYIALRRHDIRGLQSDLTDLGVTSLTTAEPNVRAKVRAAGNMLAALR